MFNKAKEKLALWKSEVKSNPAEYAMAGGVLFIILMMFLSFAAWVTHVVVCLQDEAWAFLIAGAIMFPIAIVHGFGLWFGLF